MLREPLDILLCLAFLVMAAAIAGLLLELPECVPDTAGHCAYYSSP